MKAIETSYKDYRFRSRLEARWAVFFEAVGLDYEYELEGFVLPDGTYYLPDFYLPTVDRWVEIKPRSYDREENWPSHPVIELFSSLYHEANELKEEHEGFFEFAERFILIRGNPYLNEYEGFISCDCGYLFCQCDMCGRIGIEFEGRGARIPCGCDHSGHAHYDKCYNTDSPDLTLAYSRARSARFEHGEMP